MAISNLRKDDERCADIVSRFLDENFYKKYVKYFDRIIDKERQVKGIDTTFMIDDKTYICDEKAAIRYINKGLNTFSLELSFIGRYDDLRDGWLIDEKHINNSFLFVWIDKAKADMLESVSDIQQLEIALVDRRKILKYLETLGWSQDKMIAKSQKMRENEEEYGGNLRKHGCKFVCSRHLVEQPVNVLLSRDKLKEISDLTLNWTL